MRERSSTIAPGLAMAPPARPVPAPRGTTGVAGRVGDAHDGLHVGRRMPRARPRAAASRCASPIGPRGWPSRAAGSVVTDAPRASWRRARTSCGIPPPYARRPMSDFRWSMSVGACEAGGMTPQTATLTRPARAAADPLADPVFAERYRAMQARDARFDGQFITGVHSTGIYCRPSCPAVAPKPSNVSFYLTAAAAHEAGLRACKRCLPDAVPGSPEWDLRDDLAARAMRLIADGVVEREGVPGLAARLGYTPRHLTRVLTAELGAGPLALARAHRAQTARALLTSTALPAADVAFASGFGSIRQFNDTIRAVYERSPLELRMAARLRERGIGRPRSAPSARPPTPALRRRRRAWRSSRMRASCACGCPPVRRSTPPACSTGSRTRALDGVEQAGPTCTTPAPSGCPAGPRLVAVRGRRRRPRAVDRRRGAPRDPRRPAAARRARATPVRPRRRRRGDRRRPSPPTRGSRHPSRPCPASGCPAASTRTNSSSGPSSASRCRSRPRERPSPASPPISASASTWRAGPDDAPTLCSPPPRRSPTRASACCGARPLASARSSTSPVASTPATSSSRAERERAELGARPARGSGHRPVDSGLRRDARDPGARRAPHGRPRAAQRGGRARPVRPTPRALQAEGARWAPWRSYASMHLWRAA